MNIKEFAEGARAKSKGKVKSAIAERWNTRVVPQGLDRLGKSGAQAYLDAYGKNVASAKVVELALCAEHMQVMEMAAGFWEAAYFLETGSSEVLHVEGSAPSGDTPISAPLSRKVGNSPTLEGFPAHLQPGLIQTMQPIDMQGWVTQATFIRDPNYIGQPKRDGHRNVLFATEGEVYHQSRSTNGLSPLGESFEAAAKETAKELGPFILDGERYYQSVTGSEHRTAAQCATANAEAGSPTVLPIPVFAAFEALFADGEDFTKGTKLKRIEICALLITTIQYHLTERGSRAVAEKVPTAITKAEKSALAAKQVAESREGEVWTHRDAPYQDGKKHGDSYRTKYVQEGMFTILSYKVSTTASRAIASFELADEFGDPCGSVGTGFDDTTGKRLAAKHDKNPGTVKVEVRYQGLTEGGSLWHPRMI